MSPGFFTNTANNTGDSLSYEMLSVKNIKDIPMRNDYPIARNIVRLRNIDCINASRIKKSNKYITF